MRDRYGSVPGHWRRARVKSVAERVTDGAHISPDTEDGVYDFVSTRDVKGGRINYQGSLKTSPETYEYMVKSGCRPNRGDVLFSKDGTVGETAIVMEQREFAVASSLVIITPRASVIVPSYLAYVFASRPAQEQAASFMRGAGLPRLSVGNLARLEVLVPPLEEQCAIADYLDRETARIDTLIEEQQHLMDLLRERRRSVIGHGVEGADGPRVELKFGLSRAISDGPHETPEFISEGIPFLSVDAIQDGRLVFEGCRFISEQDHLRYSAKVKPMRGDVLIGKAASTGKIAIVDTDREFNVWSPLAILRPAPDLLDGRWVEWALKAPIAQAQIDMACTYNTQKNISMDDIGRLRIVFPSLDEQRRIAAYLDEQTTKIDTLITESERFIELSRERRSALITAAVTGQIDVRAVA